MSDPKDTKDRRGAGSGGGESGDKAILPEFVRRAFAMGLSSLFTTEEAFRRALGDTVPKDWVDFAVDQSDRTRSELMGRMAEEMARVIENMDLEAVLRRMLAEHRVEIRAELNFLPREPDSRSEDRGKQPGKTSAKVKAVSGGRSE